MITEEQFLRAAADGDIELVKQYIQEGGNIDAIDENRSSVEYGKTALMWASQNGHFDMIKCLIEASADIDAKDKYSCTALMFASYNGHLGVVKYLIGADADINSKNNDGNTALQIASYKGHTEVVKVLENPNEIYLRKKLDIENASDVIKDSCIF